MSAVDEIAAYLAHLKTSGNRIDQIIFDELPNGEEMTATDELRRLLDERGVEWGNIRNDGSESDYLTEWQFEGVQSYAVATEWAVGGGLSLETHRHHLTPEQAIAATLGAVEYRKPTTLSQLEAENAKLREERDMYRDLVGCMVHPDIPDQLAAENGKLRELVRQSIYAMDDADWASIVSTAIALGVEVTG